MDLSGKWNFKEDFSHGKDVGVAILVHQENEIKGILEITESIKGDEPFKVKCEIKGTVDGNHIELHVISFEILDSSEEIEYYPESREGILNVNGQIVGSSEDEQGVCGVFVMERI